MPREVALVFCSLFIIYLLWRDCKQESSVSSALWIPMLYILILGSRFVSEWIAASSNVISTQNYEEGSPLDRAIFLAFLGAGLIVLLKRKINWSEIFRDNVWLWLFFVYGGISILWSDFPFVAFKRWVKVLENVILVLVVLTEAVPVDAVKALIRRSAYVLVPLSILLIKYYPEFGRGYDRWTGAAMYTGVGYNKNALGYLCLVCGFFFFWSLFSATIDKAKQLTKQDIFIHILFLGMISWLLMISDSKTSIGCLAVGASVVFMLKIPTVRNNFQKITVLTLLILLVAVFAGVAPDLMTDVVQGMGRDASLTDRVPLWGELIGMVENPVFGEGFESFFLGARIEQLWAKHWWHPTQAHNGYIETYLHLGFVGVLVLLGVLWSAYSSACNTFKVNMNYAKFRLGLVIIALIYNVTEAAFKGQHLIFFCLLLVAVNVPLRTNTVSLTGERTRQSHA
jgi:exopolysaccharide production protein ExoQ